ncbi:IclR family transcriptional regulator [Ruegeria conchae]|uniref:IclR family transcriptional regulator n=1 Tax=Ruegeria conchae TaxID=981384 RepID=A0A497ZWL5_9RHOB|nr:IclR family transcriptional regulator [Ruegeria conchae]RLK07397.1 IclR family transcriptional regulator [Ruegeria conchae]
MKEQSNSAPAQAEAKYRAPALEKGLEILELLSTSQEPLTQTEIARALGRSKNEIFRMLATLVQHGYVSKTQSGDGYSLSLKLFATAQRYSPIARLLEVATPLLRRVTKRVWQSCQIGMESGGNIVIVSSVEAPGHWGLAIRTGSVIGLWNTGTGRVLAAFRPEDEIEELLEQHRLALGEPPLDREKFFEELRVIRQSGFYRGVSDTTIGVTNLSFPIFNPSGEIVAALSCPYLERVDNLRTATIDETEKVFAEIAEQLTNYFLGNAIQDDHGL